MALTDKLKAIADAIRAKTGDTAEMTLDEMPEKIAAIEAGGTSDVNLIGIIERTAKTPTLPEGLTSIGAYAFYEHTTLALTELPDSIESIDKAAFSGCANLALTKLPANLQSIGEQAFNYCINLAITEIPEYITDIGDNAFGFLCNGIKELTFLGHPEEISSNAFSGCTNLKTINVPWSEGDVDNAPWGATKATINYDYKK